MVQMWFKLSGINFHVAGTKRTWILFSEIFGNLPKPDFKGTKNGGNRQEYDLSFWSKEKGLQRLHPNPSVHSFYNRLLLESGIMHTSIVSMVYLVHWAILYRFQ